MPHAFEKDGVAVITGGASGIGRAAARRAAGAGMKIVLVDVNATKLEATAAELTAVVGEASVLARVVDVASAEAMNALATEVEAKFARRRCS